MNGVVDAADYVVWRNRLETNTPLTNEGVSPGMVDQADYDFWKANFGKSMGSGATTDVAPYRSLTTLFCC